MKTIRSNKRSGFTLVEMIGVLAVIAVLAALLVPRVFAAINESRINNAVSGVNSLKAAAMQYFGKYGCFGDANGGQISATTNDWDQVLLKTGMLERPFETRLGATTNTIRLVTGGTVSAAVSPTSDSFDLSGSGSVDTSSAKAVVIAVIQGIAADDAAQIDQRIDGKTMSYPVDTTYSKGRVKWDGATETLKVYIAHK